MSQKTIPESLSLLSVPASGPLAHPDNRIIIAELDQQRRFERSVTPEDLMIISQPSWLQSDRLVSLFDGWLEDHFICSVEVYAEQLTILINDFSSQPAHQIVGQSSLIIAPQVTSDYYLMLALYLVDIFECPAYIELLWQKCAGSNSMQFYIVRDEREELQVNTTQNSPLQSPAANLKPPKKTAKPKASKKTPEPKASKKTPEPSKPKSQTVSQPLQTKTVPPQDNYADLVNALTTQGWISQTSGHKKRFSWGLIDCAKYITLVAQVYGQANVSKPLIHKLHKEFSLAGDAQLTKYLGDSPSEWVQNAQAFLD